MSEAPAGTAIETSTRLWWALLLAVTTAVFARGLDHAFVNWDDFIYVTENPLVQAPGSVPWHEHLTTPQLGYPLPWVVACYRLCWWVGGGATWPFHAINLVVHLATASLLFVTFRRAGLLGPSSALIALGFAVHPLVVEPVAWVTGLKDVWMGLGVLLAWMYRRRPWAMFGAGVLALASKPVAVLLGPGLLFALWLDAKREDDDQSRAGSWAVAGGLTVMGLGLALWTASAETEALRTTSDVAFSPLNISGAAGLMAAHALVPLGLAPSYAPSSAPPGMMVLGVVALAFALINLYRWGKRHDARAGLVAMSLLLYLPVSNLRPLVRFTADSYAYTPWIFVAMIIGCTVAQAPAWARRVRLAAGAIVAIWAAVSVAQVGVWKDSVSLWAAAYESQPDDPVTVYRYGDALGRAGRNRDEVALYLSSLPALQQAPKIPVALVVFFERSGAPDEAAAWYRLAFSKPTAQDDAVYWYYAEFVARYPQLHDPKFDDALRVAIQKFAERRAPGYLDAATAQRLRAQAQRLGLGELRI